MTPSIQKRDSAVLLEIHFRFKSDPLIDIHRECDRDLYDTQDQTC